MNENSQKGKKRKPRTPRQHIDPEGLNRQPQFERPLGKILDRLKDPVPGPDRWDDLAGKYLSQYAAFCPAHGDHNKSLSVSETAEGNVLICCHADCTPKEILNSIGLEIYHLYRKGDERRLHIRPGTARYVWTHGLGDA